MPDQELEDTLLKKLIRINAGAGSEGRTAQITQYQNPDKDILPRQPLRPTSLSKFRDQVFRSMAEYAPRVIKLGPGIVGKKLSELRLPMPIDEGTDRGYTRIMVPGPKGHVIGSLMDQPSLDTGMGLGRARLSVGMDDKKKPYMSVFDS